MDGYKNRKTSSQGYKQVYQFLFDSEKQPPIIEKPLFLNSTAELGLPAVQLEEKISPLILFLFFSATTLELKEAS